MQRIALFVNPLFTSRSGRSLPQILHIFQQAGVHVDVQQTAPNHAAGLQARQAVEQGTDAILVCGGDGTVFDVLQGIAGSNVPLGILPFGTGNILAQNLNIPRKTVDAAHWLLTAKPHTIPLAKITCCIPDGSKTWFFAMSAGMGIHAAMLKAAQRIQKHRTGRAAYFAAGLQLLASHPLQPFDVKITTLDGSTLHRQPSELIAVRVAALNLWRPGGGLDLPFLRLATVTGNTRSRLAQASFQALFLGAGKRDRPSPPNSAAHYEDVLRVECSPIPGRHHKTPIAVQADGEVLGASCATIEMANLNINFLSHSQASPAK